MKVIKPHRLSVLQRVVEHRRKYSMVVTVLTYVPIADSRKLLMEMQLVKDVAESVFGGIIDEGFPKPCGEVLVSGSAYAVGGEPVTGVMTRLVVSRGESRLVDKKLAVVGNRYWIGNDKTDPAPFTKMPVDWAHAFGGEGFESNPHGKGAAPVATEAGEVVPLPNVEHPRRPVESKDHRPLPTAYCGYEMGWPQRMSKVGKEYGDRWLKEAYPGPAVDFDAHFYNSAPEDQHIDGFFDGSEKVIVDGMHPSRQTLEGALTPLTVKAFATQRHGEEERFVMIPTRPDTIHVLPDRETMVVVYRGTLEVTEDDADDIVHLIVAAEDPDHPKSPEHYQAVLAKRLDKDIGALASLKDEDLMPPATEGWFAKPDYGDMADMTRLDQRAFKNMERGRKKKLAKSKADLEAAGFDVGDAFVEPELPEVPDPYDADAMLELNDRMQELSTRMQAELEERRAQMEADARSGFEDAGFDYQNEMQRAEQKSGGPPDFSADDHLVMLHDMARIAAEGGEPLPELERNLLDPQYEEMLLSLERQVRSAYIMFAHMMPSAAVPGEQERHQLRIQVQAAHDSGEPMSRKRLIGADLHGMDLAGMDLSDALLEGADLAGANLRGANLRGAVLVRATLTDCSLADADLSGANLGDCKLVNTDLSGANLHETVFMRSELDGAIFIGATLAHTEFIEVKFTSADFSHATLHEPLFLQVDLRNATFTGANMPGARLLMVDVRGVDFTGAQLPKAQFIQAAGDGACFAGADVSQGVFVYNTSLVGANFGGANLTGTNLRKTPLTDALFANANLDGADVSTCDLRRANLYRCRGRGALWMRTDLRGADMRGADLLGAFLTKALLQGTNLSGSNLSRADLALVHVDGATKLDDALSLNARVVPQRANEELPL